MRQALEEATLDHAQEIEIPAPVGGINGLDPLSAMEPTDAVVLDNWYQVGNTLQIRRGMMAHADTGQTGAYIDSMFSYDAAGRKSLVAAANGKLFDVTSSSPFLLKSGLSDNDWIAQEFAERVFIVNNSGADEPQVFNGITVSPAGFVGANLNPSALNHVFAFKSRLYFIEKNTLNLWYGDLAGVTGDLTKFNLLGAGMGGGVRGGTLVAGATITQDGGDGTDDLMVLFTSRGEAIVYQGDDPGASNWALVGVFEVGEPLHRRAFANSGADLLITTRRGVSPLTQTFAFGRSLGPPTLNDKLGDAFRDLIRRTTVLEGWQIEPYPRANMVLVNVPVSDDTWHQYVMNTRTQSWTRFTGQNGKAWHVFDNRLFCGGVNGKVYESDRGFDDAGVPITAVAVPAWIRPFGGREGAMKFIRPILSGNVQPALQLSSGADYAEFPDLTNAATRVYSGAPVWDESQWDQVSWNGNKISYYADWCAAQQGRAFGMKMSVTSSGALEWQATGYVVEPAHLI